MGCFARRVDSPPFSRRGMSSLQQLSSISKLLAIDNHQKSDAHHIHSFRNVSDRSDFPTSGNSARHRVHQVIDAEFEGRGSVVEGSAAFIEPFPEFADVVVVVYNHLQIAVGVTETEKLDRALAGEVIGGNHIEGLDLVKRIEYRIG